MISEIVIPELGATGGDVTIAAWLVKTGDFVQAGTPLFELITDKATVEVEAFRDGFIREIRVSADTTVALGTVVGLVADSMDEPLKFLTPEISRSSTTTKTIASISDQHADVENKVSSSGRILASPLARRIAKEQGIEISALKGTGRDGAIIKRDVMREIATQSQTGPAGGARIASHWEGRIKRVQVSPMRRAIANRTRLSKSEAPHFYITSVIDMTEARTFLKQMAAQADQDGWVSPTITDLAIRAAALSLQEVPQVNATFREDEIIYFEHIHISMVVGLPEGMIVPVVRHADQKDLYSLAAITRRLRNRAEAGQLSSSELTGSTFTITNLGMYAVDSFIAVINPPEAAILALGAIREQPAVWEGQILPRALMTVTLSSDHRLVDGLTAARFMNEFKQFLENPRSLVLTPPGVSLQ